VEQAKRLKKQLVQVEPQQLLGPRQRCLIQQHRSIQQPHLAPQQPLIRHIVRLIKQLLQLNKQIPTILVLELLLPHQVQYQWLLKFGVAVVQVVLVANKSLQAAEVEAVAMENITVLV
jgi:hypothetical protein